MLHDIDREPATRGALRRFRAATIDALARLALHGVDHLGARARVHGLPFVENLGRIAIGDDLELHAAPTRSHLVTGPRGVIEIADGVTIGEGAAIAAEERIAIGDGARLGAFVMLLDADYHTARDRSERGATAPIVIGAHARLGDRVTVLHGATVGAWAHVEAGSVVSGMVPEGAVFAGVPARPIRRAEDERASAAQHDLLERIQRVAARVFVLPDLPAPTMGPATIPGWDSLGALRLLVSLEEELAMELPAGAIAGARDLHALADLIAARARS